MQFGVQLPTYWPDYGDWTVRAAIEKTAQTAQELGFASVWCNDQRWGLLNWARSYRAR